MIDSRTPFHDRECEGMEATTMPLTLSDADLARLRLECLYRVAVALQVSLREADRANLTPIEAGEAKPVWPPDGHVICGRCGYLTHPPTCWNCKQTAATPLKLGRADAPTVETPLQRAVRIVSET